MINVTKTFFPPKKEYEAYLTRIWKNEWLTNRGELVKELESKLVETLETPPVLLMSNGTVPLQVALRLLANKGEIITTPFSYVATTASIVWEYCTPVFVDIDPNTFSIDEQLIEAAITPRTTAIMPTHVFGNPCNVIVIEELSKKHDIPVIYDAAHSFGVKYNGKSIFEYGTISTCSFHATKLFHTGEGGAIFCKDKKLFETIDYSHKFGHDGPLKFKGLGVNAKMSELQAAMGLSVLPYIDSIIEHRKVIVDTYLDNLNLDLLKTMKIREGTEWNYSYFPVVFNSEEQLLKIEKALQKDNIIPRRYFYPSLNKLPYVTYLEMPHSEKIAKTILCLPLSHTLTTDETIKICSIINMNLER